MGLTVAEQYEENEIRSKQSRFTLFTPQGQARVSVLNIHRPAIVVPNWLPSHQELLNSSRVEISLEDILGTSAPAIVENSLSLI